MSDFTHGFWDLFVSIGTLVSIVACAVLLVALSKRKTASDPDKTGHVWDEDLDEYNNPLPRWWIWLFWITIVFSFAYLWYFPGLGTHEGALKWTSVAQYDSEIDDAKKQYGPLYARLATKDLATLAFDPEAKAVGQKLFINYCSQCHASDARGTRGFPNLTDHDWLYGGEPQIIKTTILNGRNGNMPALGAAIGPGGVKDTTNYVRALSGLAHDAAAAERGKTTFGTLCAACHGPEGKGNPAVGAPNLTDKIWLHGSSETAIAQTIAQGRASVMPAHKDFLGEERVHILAAYVFGLSQPEPVKGPVAVIPAKARQ